MLEIMESFCAYNFVILRDFINWVRFTISRAPYYNVVSFLPSSSNRRRLHYPFDMGPLIDNTWILGADDGNTRYGACMVLFDDTQVKPSYDRVAVSKLHSELPWQTMLVLPSGLVPDLYF